MGWYHFNYYVIYYDIMQISWYIGKKKHNIFSMRTNITKDEPYINTNN